MTELRRQEQLRVAEMERQRREEDAASRARVEQEARSRASIEAERQRADAEISERWQQLEKYEEKLRQLELLNRNQEKGRNIQILSQLMVPVLGFLTLVALSIVTVSVRNELPVKLKILIVVVAPIASTAIFYFLGVKDELTLVEVPIVVAPLGGGLVAALLYKHLA